ncbi:hypothetical protein HPB47_020431 [Ixodes persulcatus]|uniref:Uncharacterized protein n=2 Tax=Ixodes persulcatus TaxID=34615 RepID=A0AC60QFF2_IXOPE|nr:hypothetical protein HPB47_020430 [Ixodes persulcatus]KAG0432877.1 hypothetical protein HPB47_020431 [Ixodes persulcatus]
MMRMEDAAERITSQARHPETPTNGDRLSERRGSHQVLVCFWPKMRERNTEPQRRHFTAALQKPRAAAILAELRGLGLGKTQPTQQQTPAAAAAEGDAGVCAGRLLPSTACYGN